MKPVTSSSAIATSSAAHTAASKAQAAPTDTRPSEPTETSTLSQDKAADTLRSAASRRATFKASRRGLGSDSSDESDNALPSSRQKIIRREIDKTDKKSVLTSCEPLTITTSLPQPSSADANTMTSPLARFSSLTPGQVGMANPEVPKAQEKTPHADKLPKLPVATAATTTTTTTTTATDPTVSSTSTGKGTDTPTSAPGTPKSPRLKTPRNRESRFGSFVSSTTRRMSQLSDSSLFEQWNQMKASAAFTSLSMLSDGEWTSKDPQASLDRIPVGIRNKLSDEYLAIAGTAQFQSLPVELRDAYLKSKLAKRLIALMTEDPARGFDKAASGSPEMIREFLGKQLKVKIQAAVRADDLQAEQLPEKEKRGMPTNDLRDKLLEDAIARTGNYRVDHVLDLNDPAIQSIVEDNKDKCIEKLYGNETVEKSSVQHPGATATFCRDFGHSGYWLERPSGERVRVMSIESLIEAIGDPNNPELSRRATHVACQNLPNFLKNLYFMTMEGSGTSLSPVRLFDGRRIGLSLSPHCNFTFRKETDGAITVFLLAEYDTSQARAQQRLTAKILDDPAQQRVLIEGKSASIAMTVRVSPEGIYTFGNPRFKAEGWNRLAD